MTLVALAGRIARMGASGFSAFGSAAAGLSPTLLPEQARQRDRAETDAAVSEEMAAGLGLQDLVMEVHGFSPG